MSENQKAVLAPERTVSAIKEFLGAHGGKGSVVIQPIGRIGVRLTLVGVDGVLGDQVVGDLATANAVVAALPGLEVAEWDRELTGRATPAPGHALKMAGWVANS
jgi:hypothetical protein